jgi:hypothetical protein
MKKKLSMKKTNSIFLFLMQSYVDFGTIPRNLENFTQTCMDNGLDNGQNEGLTSFFV